MTKIAVSGSESGSGSISQRHGSADPDPDPYSPQNVMNPEHWFLVFFGCARECWPPLQLPFRDVLIQTRDLPQLLQ
jgi:hypothetical protein